MFGNPLLLADEGYQISRSVRLRSSASAYFNRTPASASNRKTMTLSTWQKRGEFSSSQEPAIMWAGTNSSNYTLFRWGNGVGNSDSKFFLNLNMYTGTTNINLVTTPLFRDPSGWYHIVLSIDTTQATAANRVRLYVNGVEITSFSSASYPSQNLDLLLNSTNSHEIGRFNFGSYLDGYLTEINFIDGQALTPSSFGETDAITGVWKPKKYTGTYGTNGFYLNFSDNSNNTATTIGKDYSGNGNNWTPNNISVTSGATYDSMLDVPTPWADGGNGRGNYCVINPLNLPRGGSCSNGNLLWTSPSAEGQAVGTIYVSSGKWYWEMVQNVAGGCGFGIAKDTTNINSANLNAGAYTYYTNGNKYDASTGSAYGATFTNGDVIGVALDLDAGTLAFYKNNVSQGTAFTGLSGNFTALIYDGTGAATPSFDANFGQRPFAYTPPSGFKALHTGNLPEPTIKKGNAYFDATLWTGNGSNRSISNSGAMQPDLVWIKSRSIAGYYHVLTDSVRGTASQLFSNDTLAQETRTDRVTSFNSDGFSLGVKNDVNDNGATFVGWQWKEGATQGFDIVTYTGNGANRTIAHSLGVAPRMMIIKRRDTTSNWTVYHASITSPQDNFLYLNSTSATVNAGVVFNSTVPTSSNFSLGTDVSVNANAGTYVNYLFAEVAGFSKFGSYTGNGSTDGPFIHLGFRARFVVFKVASGTTGNWKMHDTARGTYNADHPELLAESSAAEGASTGLFDITANGIKLRTTSTNYNGSGNTYIFMAFAENPFKNALAR